jgi:hypothetical protein
MPLFRKSVKEISREDLHKKIVPVLIQKLTDQYSVYSTWLSALPEISGRHASLAKRIRLLQSLQQNRACLSLSQLVYLLDLPLFKGGYEYQNMAKAIIYHYGIPALQHECLRQIELAECDIGEDCRSELKQALITLDKIKNAVPIERHEYVILVSSIRFQEILRSVEWAEWLSKQWVIIKEVKPLKGVSAAQAVFLPQDERSRADSTASTASLAESRSARSDSAASDCSYEDKAESAENG